jgi:protein SMG6
MSDHSGAARSSHARGEPSHRQLFDHRKDDPVRFQVLARPGGGSAAGRGTPQPKGSSDWISTGSQSSYSVASSSFTLSSTTDGSSASGASGLSGGMKSNNARPEDVGGFSDQLKRLYRGIVALEAKLVRDDALESNEDVRVVLRGQESPIDEEAQNERWKKTIFDHKRSVPTNHFRSP